MGTHAPEGTPESTGTTYGFAGTGMRWDAVGAGLALVAVRGGGRTVEGPVFGGSSPHHEPAGQGQGPEAARERYGGINDD